MVEPDEFERWRRALLRAGRLHQDADDTPEAVWGKRFNRYLELVGMVDGTEGPDVFASLLDSLRVRHDYGAYQQTLTALDRFPREAFVAGLMAGMVKLHRRQPRWSGDLLCRFICLRPDYVVAFNRALAKLPPGRRAAVRRVILAHEEDDTWLQEHVGKLDPDYRR